MDEHWLRSVGFFVTGLFRLPWSGAAAPCFSTWTAPYEPQRQIALNWIFSALNRVQYF